MGDMPERIWADNYSGKTGEGYWRNEPLAFLNGGTQYVRADLAALPPAPDAAEAMVKAAGLRFTGLHPTPFGEMIGIEGYPPDTMMLVSVCGPSGIKPVRCLLWHQFYTKHLPDLEAQGEVVICAVPFASAQFALTAAIRAGGKP